MHPIVSKAMFKGPLFKKKIQFKKSSYRVFLQYITHIFIWNCQILWDILRRRRKWCRKVYTIFVCLVMPSTGARSRPGPFKVEWKIHKRTQLQLRHLAKISSLNFYSTGWYDKEICLNANVWTESNSVATQFISHYNTVSPLLSTPCPFCHVNGSTTFNRVGIDNFQSISLSEISWTIEI